MALSVPEIRKREKLDHSFRVGADELESRMERIATVMRTCASRMPMHQEFIDRHCRAEAV